MKYKAKMEGHFCDIILNEKHLIYVSVASYWEIAIKKALGRIEMDCDLKLATEESGFTWLGIELRHIDFLKQLPPIHHDPFDRLLISQAVVDEMRFLSVDSKILQYKTENTAFLKS